MKRIFFIVQILIAIVCCYSFAYGQANNASKSIVAKLETFSGNHPTEKAWLQFDKLYYAAGDTIYFKAYITAGEQHRLSTLSGLLHVDLINTDSKVDQSIKLQIDSGVTWGDFALPDTLPKGDYRVRAYTQWMRNNGENDFFDKVIPVGAITSNRIPESLVKQPARAIQKPDVQFLPEGGSLIAGIRSKVAFKAIGSNGNGMEVKGMVVDDEGKEIVSFTSAHLGMGYFYLNPAERKTYKAEITYANGTTDIVDLPKPEASGLVLSVNNDSLPKASVSITANGEYYRQNRGKAYTLVIYSGGIITTVSCKLDSPLICLNILKRKLHTGIATITLFSPENEPLSERLIFVQNYDQLSLGINSDKSNYLKREKVRININALNRKGDAAEGHFSVSVTDEHIVPDNEKNSDNIISYLLLTSDLKGYIEQPDYYFSDTSATARNNLDVLMLTQGYRRFEWKQVLDSADHPLVYQPEKGIEIAGQVKSPLNKPIANGTITLLQPNGGLFLNSTTDDKGMFHFSDLVFTDTANFVLSAVNSNRKNNTKITYFNDKDYGTAVVANQRRVIKQFADTAMASYLESDKLQQRELLNYGIGKVKMLKEVNIKDKKPDDLYRTQSLAGAGHADQVMHADEIEQIGGQLSTSLNGRLRGVAFIRGVPVLRAPPGNGPMLVMIDGTPYGGNINDLPSSEIETIEVLRFTNASIYGLGGANGVLVITTKQGATNPKDIASVGVLPIAVMGFYKAREFYSPKYDSSNITNKQRDLRSTIYWKPEIKTDKDGNASFEYYNADGAGTCKVVVEGVDNNGNIGRQVYRYKVE